MAAQPMHVLHHVRMAKALQERNLSNGCRRNPVVLEFESDLLQGHNFVRDPVLRLVHRPVGAFAQLRQLDILPADVGRRELLPQTRVISGGFTRRA